MTIQVLFLNNDLNTVATNTVALFEANAEQCAHYPCECDEGSEVEPSLNYMPL